MDKNELKKFQKKWGLKFNNFNLLVRAFTHSSYANQNNVLSNERLEFLGDAVLELATSKFLFDKFKKQPEGELTKKRAKNVCEPALFEYAKKMELNKYILLSKGEEHNGGRERPAILADAFEALLGALYLDQGIKPVYRLLEKVVFPQILEDTFEPFIDYKSTFQELVQSSNRSNVEYRIISEEGPAHNKTFEMGVFLDNIRLGTGFGKNKKEAEQNAAKVALEKLAIYKKK